MKVINPYTGKMITVGGVTYKKVIYALFSEGYSEEDINSILRTTIIQKGGSSTPSGSRSRSGSGMFSELLSKVDTMNSSDPKISGHGSGQKKDIRIPDSKYHLLNSANPPNPTQHSWYHHHAPFSQNFGDYVCLKRSTLKDLGGFMRDAFFTDIDGINLSGK